MSEDSHMNWRDLCSAVIEAKDPDEVLELVVRINQILECEEHGRAVIQSRRAKPTRLPGRDHAKQ
jgi:hypothetical protein